MEHVTKLMAIGAILTMEAIAIFYGVNGDTLIYAIGGVVALGGGELIEKFKQPSGKVNQ